MVEREYLVVWDGYGLENIGTGIYRYAQNIARELVLSGVKPTIIWDAVPDDPIHSQINYQLVPKSLCFSKIRRLKVVWPKIAAYHLHRTFEKQEKKAIFHGLSNFNVPWSSKFHKNFRTVLTIHDMIPFIEKKSVSLSYYLQMIHILPKVVASVDHIVCVSEWTKSVLCSYFSSLEHKISVIPHGFDSFIYQERKSIKNDHEKIRLLYISRYEKYKRIELLLQILQKTKEKFVLDLVTDSKGRAHLLKTFGDLIGKGFLRVWSGLSDAEIKTLFQSADVYVHPSLYEGYGLPVAEAMSFGLPVVFQSGSAIDEVVGPDAGFPLCGTKNTLDDWIDRIIEAYNASKTTGFRNRLQCVCESRSSWRDSAGTLIAIYDRLAL